MNNFFHFVGKKLLSGILVAFLAALTVGTSIIGVGKVAGSFSSERLLRQTDVPQKEVKGVSVNVQTQTSDNRPSNTTGSKNNAGISQKNNPVLAGITPQLTSVASSGGGSCVITLFGKQYNITSLLNSHSGGNVFTCGTDMSASYQSRHGTNVGRMQPYLIGGNSNSVVIATPTPTSAPAGNNNNGSPTPTPTANPSGGSCVITLFGKQYNITSLLSSHSGGNVFTCGTDMSASYQSRHGTSVSRMQAYLISSGTTSAATPIPTPTPTRAPTPTPTRIPTPTPTRIITPTPTPIGIPSGVPTATPTLAPTPTPTRVPTPTPAGCIITLFGKQYNITSLLSSHSGGNVFTCGTDMSTIYQREHGTSVSRMQRYLIP